MNLDQLGKGLMFIPVDLGSFYDEINMDHLLKFHLRNGMSLPMYGGLVFGLRDGIFR